MILETMKILVKWILVLYVVGLISCTPRSVDKEIVLINSGENSRGEIALELDLINRYNPKVVALDMNFPDDKGSKIDDPLFMAMGNLERLVMSVGIEDYTGEDKEYLRLIDLSQPYFTENATTGINYSMGEDDQFFTQKSFVTRELVNGDVVYHFSIVTAMGYDSLSAISFLETNPRVVDIDYKRGQRKFKTFSSADILQSNFQREDIEGKIIMFGYMGPGNEDKLSTSLRDPLSKEPDMYSVEYLANIVAQILESK